MKASQKQWGDSRPDFWTPEWMPPPTYGTRRRPERKTYGAAVAKTAALHGTPMFPAQRYVVDVAHERDPETDLLAYPTVGALLNRQLGKTRVIVWSSASTRCEMFEDQDAVYLAQQKIDSKEKWRDDFIAKLEKSEHHQKGRDYEVRWEIGSEQLKFLPSQSTLAPGAVMKQSGHGGTRDLVMVDEAWWHQDFAVDSGYRVPMITRRERHPGAQFWVISAGGTYQRSIYLLDQVERGRKAVREDTGSGRCYFEWSCPLDWDIENPELWWFYIPALGHTVSERSIAEDLRDMEENEWRRAYGSQFTDEDKPEEFEPLIPVEAWARQADERSTISSGAMIGVEMDPDQVRSSLSVAGRRVEGDWHLDHVKVADGSDWVLRAVSSMMSDFPDIGGVAVASDSPASAFIVDLERLGIEVVKLTSQGAARACGLLKSEVVAGRLWHRNQPEFRDSLHRATSKPLGDLWVFRRSEDAEDSSVVIAAGAVALGGAAQLIEEPPVEDSPAIERGGLFRWD